MLLSDPRINQTQSFKLDLKKKEIRPRFLIRTSRTYVLQKGTFLLKHLYLSKFTKSVYLYLKRMCEPHH